MKHIPIMLALALSISLTSFDGSTATSSNNINVSEATSIPMTTIDSDDLSDLASIDKDERS